jgi:RNA 2',3'-cyclic 3'-phosphodiesterase
VRLFIGIGLSAQARAALARAVEPVRSAVDACWVPTELYHVTLAFLGERDGSALPALETLLRGTAADFPAFPLSVSGFGRFGREGDAILFASLENQPALPALSGALRARLAASGQAFDPKPFAPHVTLARKTRLPREGTLPAFPPIPFQADSLTLFHSVRVAGELRYLPIFQASLQAVSKEIDP